MYFVQVIVNGILLGSVYALLGVGMTMIFGIVKLTNLAHGEFVVLGAYLSTVLAPLLGIDPVLTLVFNILLLLVFRLGVVGYLVANILADFFTVLFSDF